ncbi:hypothetical protein A3C26_04610 [Candidatus Daviesbacteria bacterium RIFCSPHIGHO2_02_FULL_39_12]|uniref:histidine kinase n=1 Tax=Candidatus Daviesbacteria bacterium RIFCSPHIGHO2_02_FULL_39_12 TaxID=1797770 RepID=A0A1F5JDJ9_9BACT|nr:MAG: hypothetical protein A3C26_04610 [Candidatus Daviesbacteria bacterium RIFCSPHIGHO2_02_FULL_39_12]
MPITKQSIIILCGAISAKDLRARSIACSLTGKPATSRCSCGVAVGFIKIDNAVKFSPADSRVFLTLGYKASHFIIGIKDLGSGISRKELPKVFEDYYQGSNASKEGLGLGLFLVNDIIRRLHGMVKIKSRVNKGTNVEVWLPRAKP